ncbi:MAG: OmpA family protein [Deltaproteobacteria bacterium]|jgi:OOP family OmpA-OmpF porin|nr:OmpA family protein [Deltaproteobacteria bacterium]
MRRSRFKLLGLAMIVGLIMPGMIVTNVLAQTPIVKQVPVQRVRIVKEVVKTADNFIMLFDASGSMQDIYKDTNMKKIDLAEAMFKGRAARVPELDWNAGLYLYTPWKTFYEVQPFDKAKYGQAIDEMAAYKPSLMYRNQPTPLGTAIKNLDPILAKLSGKTVVFIFSDGQFTLSQPKIWPVPAAKEIASKYKDVCFDIISSAQTPKSQKLVNDLAAVNACSRVVTFDAMLSRPEYMTSAIYAVRDRALLETQLISRVVGLELDSILFDYNKADIRPEYHDKLDALAKFLEKNPDTYALIEGFADATGDSTYNMLLSRQRAESVKNYLMEKEIFSAAEANIGAIAEKRLVTVWYGPVVPVASDDTAEGRQLNRRVRISIGGIK